MNSEIRKIPVLSQMVCHQVHFMTQVCQGLEPEVYADGCAPGLEEGFWGEHQNFHDGLKRISVVLGFSLKDVADEIDPFFRRFMIRTNHDFGQKSQCDELSPDDDQQNGEEKQRAVGYGL